MSKLDEMRKASGGSIAESMGGGRATTLIPGEYRTGPAPMPVKLQGLKRRGDVSDIPVEKIGPDPDQPRKTFDTEALERLASSLAARGQLQPIRVRWNAEREQYVVIVGERRYQAAMKAGLPTLACVIVEGNIPPGELLAIQLVENAVREDLLPLEQANAYKSLMDSQGWSQVELAAELGIGQPAVAKALATLKLVPEIQEQVNRGELSASAGAAIAALEPQEQTEVAAEAVENNLTRDEVTDLVRERRKARPVSPSVKGRGASKGKPKPITSSVFKTTTGIRITAERAKGIDPAALVLALEEATAQARAKLELAEQGGEAEAA